MLLALGSSLDIVKTKVCNGADVQVVMAVQEI